MRGGKHDIGLDKKTVAAHSAAVDAEEHRKAGRAGQYVAGSAVLFLAIAVIAVIRGWDGIVSVSAGLCVALLVVAAMLMFESEHQRQRRDRRRHPPTA